MKKVFSEEPLAPEVIADFKAKHKGVFCISVPATDEPPVDDSGNELPVQMLDGFFRRLTIDEIGLAQRASTTNNLLDPVKSVLIMYNTSLIGGHPAFESDEEVKRAALEQFKTVIKARTATIKKV